MATDHIRVEGFRLLARPQQLGELGKTPAGGAARLALTDEDKQARDMFVSCLEHAALRWVSMRLATSSVAAGVAMIWNRWHQAFERKSPAGHQSFLEWLNISEEEIVTIRSRSA